MTLIFSDIFGQSAAANYTCFYVCACVRYSEMEFCASAASMLVEEIWQIAEGFVEVSQMFSLNWRNVDDMVQVITILECHS